MLLEFTGKGCIANWLEITKRVMSQKWPRDSVARFLDSILEPNTSIPEFYFLEFPQLFCRLVEEEDSRLATNNNSFNDWYTTAINSTRGDAMEALLKLALRQKNAGKDIEPWIFDLIRQRLQLPEESPAIFAIFGAKLRLFVHVFEIKVKELPKLLFPSGRISHQSALLEAHFKYDQPWNLIINTFPDLINSALKSLEVMVSQNKDNEDQKSDHEFGVQLGSHIACYFWNNSFANEQIGEVAIDQFFSIANSGTRATLIGQVASIWAKKSDATLDEKIIAKVMFLWERRFNQIQKNLKNSGSITNYDGELGAFIRWINCECFPFEWRYTHVRSVLEMLQKIPQTYHLLKAITEFSDMPSRLESMLRLFMTLLKKPSDELRWSLQPKELAPIILLGLDNPDTKEIAEECRDLLLRMGFYDFLNLENFKRPSAE